MESPWRRPRRAPAAPAPTPDRHYTVSLNPISVHVEVVAPLLIEERVEIDGHEVVRPGSVALAPIRPHDRGVLIVNVEAEVDVVRVVRDVDVGLLGGGRAIERGLLSEFGDVSRGSPDVVVQESIDMGGCVGSGRGHARTAGHQTQLG